MTALSHAITPRVSRGARHRKQRNSMIQLSSAHWGTDQGKDVFLYTLAGGGVEASVSNYGGVLQSFLVNDAKGKPLDIVLGYDTLEAYKKGPYFFGAMIGPVADRLAEGRCTLDGKTVQLSKNAGPDSMHSGPCGFHAQVWDTEILEDRVVFYRTFLDGALGFPGEMRVRLGYSIPKPFTLRLTYHATCGREAALSFTNHSYFNLDGARRDCLDHALLIHSDVYAETAREVDPLVTGRLLDVSGTPFDLRALTRLGDPLRQTEDREIASAGGIDHYFKVRGKGFREAAMLQSAESGLRLSCRSDADGILVYTGNGLLNAAGKAGKRYDRHWGVCLETGQLPNAVNFPQHRASVLFEPGKEYQSVTEFAIDYPGASD